MTRAPAADLLRAGGAPPHQCEYPYLVLKASHGAIWRCHCGRRWQLHVTQLGSTSWEAVWRRRWWPWPR